GIRDPLVTGVQTCALPIYLLDMAPQGQNHLGAAAPYVRDGARAIGEVEAAGGALEGQLGLLLLGDHPHAQAGLGANPLDERFAEIGRASCRERAGVWGVAR